MKKVIMFVFALGVSIFSTSPLMAGGADNKRIFSAEYMRTLNRSAATDSADAVAYNPAGVVKIGEGLYVNLSAQYCLLDYSNTVAGTEYANDEPALVPGLFGLYRRDRWAGFAAITIPAGGGKVKYDEGSATALALGQNSIAAANVVLAGMGVPNALWYDTVKAQKLEAESCYFGYTLGGAYALNDMISVSLGVRYIQAKKEATASVTISAPNPLVAPDQTAVMDYVDKANGWGAIVGANISPTEALNIGITYETQTNLDFERTVELDDTGTLVNGEKNKRDLPGLLGLGASYQIAPNLRAEADLVYYFQQNADWDGVDKNNGYDVGTCLEYTFNPKLKGSVGYCYTDKGMDADDMTPEDPELGAHSLAIGCCYEAMPDLNLNLALERSSYIGETTTTGIELNKTATVIAFGIQYKFM